MEMEIQKNLVRNINNSIATHSLNEMLFIFKAGQCA